MQSYRVFSDEPAIVQVTQSSQQIPSAILTALSPGLANITACVMNFYNHAICKSESLRVPEQNLPNSDGGGIQSKIPGISSAAGILGSALLLLALVAPIAQSKKEHRKQSRGLIQNNTAPEHLQVLKAQLPNIDQPGGVIVLLRRYNHALQAALEKCRQGEDPTDELSELFLSGLPLMRRQQIDGDRLLSLAKRFIEEEIPAILSRDNSELVIHGLTFLLFLTTLVSASRVKSTQAIKYDLRNALLAWIDESASFIKGNRRTPKDYQIIALLKLIRSTLEPLETNEPLWVYIKKHFAGILGTLFNYAKSHSHRGNYEQTKLVILGVLALSKASTAVRSAFAANTAAFLLGGEDPKKQDWRIQTLALMIMKRSTGQENLLQRYSGISRANSDKKQRGCLTRRFNRFKNRHQDRAANRTGIIAEALHQRTPDRSSPRIQIENPLRNPQIALSLFPGSRSSAPAHLPPPPPGGSDGRAAAPRALRVARVGGLKPPPPPSLFGEADSKESGSSEPLPNTAVVAWGTPRGSGGADFGAGVGIE
jgi:hypothetical protein